MFLLEREARRKLGCQYDDCPTECLFAKKQWDWRRADYCGDCPHKGVRETHKELLDEMLQIRLGDEASEYKPNELEQMVFEISKHEESERSQMGAKDSRLLSLFLTEKAKLDRQNEPKKP